MNRLLLDAQYAKSLWFLSEFCFQSPDLERLQTQRDLFSGLLETDIDDESQEWAKSLLNEVSRGIDNQTFRDQLGQDYVLLLSGVKQNVTLKPPFETLWLNEEKQQILSSIADFYAVNGFQGVQGISAMPDFLGTQLQFLAVGMEQAKTAENDDLASDYLLNLHHFLPKHLLAWLPDYVEQAMEAAHTNYYRTVLALIAQTVEETAGNIVTTLDLVEF